MVGVKGSRGSGGLGWWGLVGVGYMAGSNQGSGSGQGMVESRGGGGLGVVAMMS